MELKTKEDFVNAFIACGKKYGFCKLDSNYNLYDFCNDIPKDLGDEKLYLYYKTEYKDGGSYLEHVTEEWNRSEETYERCKPYDVTHNYTDELTTRPIFAWFVKQSFIGRDGALHHIVTDIRGTQYNRRSDGTFDKDECSYDGFDIFGKIREYNEDNLLTYNQHDSVWSMSFNHVEEKGVVWGIWYQCGKVYVDYRSCCGNYLDEAELVNNWRAFTTYEEVLAFQKSEELRLKKESDELNSAHEHLQDSIKELLDHAGDVLKEINEFKRKTNNVKNNQQCGIESFIKEYSNFDFFGRKWVSNW